MTKQNIDDKDVASLDDVASDDTATSLPDQKFIVYGEYVEIDDGEGGTAMVERPYDEPRVVDEIGPNERGNHLPIE